MLNGVQVTLSCRVLLRGILALAPVFAAATACAADPVTEAMTRAYAPYRVALFRTNSGTQDESRQAVAQAQLALKQVAEKFAARPAPPYDRDANFAATLARVDAVYAKAATEVGANRLAEAHETLEEARDLLADLRRRNNVVTFSDHMNAYHAEMEHVLKDGVKMLATPDGTFALVARTGVLNYLAQRLASEAPADMTGNAEFGPLVKAVQESVAQLTNALVRQDASGAGAALGRLKQPYARLFMKFG